MSKAKLRLITVFALAVLCIFTLGFAVSALSSGRTAYAATYSPSSIFEEVDGAKVGASEAGDGETSYVQFTLKTGNRVEFRRDLALKWFVADEEKAKTADVSKGDLVNPGKAQYFSMTFAFGEIAFETFDITFQSAEENVTKDGQTTNSLHFAYDSETESLTVAVRDSDYEKGDEDKSPKAIAAATADLAFSLIEDKDVPGNFDVYLAQGSAEAEKIGSFTNIGGYFLEYRSTTATTSQLPMLFEAALPETAGEETAQTVLMKSLNGQTFGLNKDGVIEDNAPAVLVVNEMIYSFRLGQRCSLSYERIDVCDRSVTVERQYYMLKRETSGDGEKRYFVKPTDSDYSALTSNSTFFMPTEDNVDAEDENGEKAYVSIRIKLDDGTDANDTYVYLTWYADLDANVVETKGDTEEGGTAHQQVVGYNCSDPNCSHYKENGAYYTVKDYEKLEKDATCTGTVTTKEEGGTEKKEACTKKVSEYAAVKESNYFDYIVVDREAEGPHFKGLEARKKDEDDGNGGTLDKNSNVSTWTPNEEGKTPVDVYQTKVAEAAEDVSAGDGSYFYLPSLETLIGSNYADYRNLRFSIYYLKPSAVAGSSASSATSLRYNNLRFEVDEVGPYTFRVIAQDAAGNVMKYYDKDGELVTVTASNVYDIEGIPEFTFDIGYTGPTIEKPGSQTTAYNKQDYTISGFDVVALEGYDAEYKLYSFAAAEEGQKAYSAEDLVAVLDEVKEDLFDETNKDNVLENGEKYSALTGRMEKINVYDPNVTEKDSKWDDTDNDYEWDPESSLSFTPQAVGLYVVEIAVTDGTYPGYTAHAYKVIEVTNESDILYGSSNWIRNNTTAIILFAISAVLLVAIILLLVVKPNEKNLEEVDLSTLKGVKKRKDKSSGK